jgi:hypothetical protein
VPPTNAIGTPMWTNTAAAGANTTTYTETFLKDITSTGQL